MIRVDVRNPGQFLACCGLLELADRLWGPAEGWFEGDGFVLDAAHPPIEVLRALVECDVTAPSGLGGVPVPSLIAPLRIGLPAPCTPLVLDAWVTLAVGRDGVEATANPPWNFWSGQQTSIRIWRALRAELAGQLDALAGRDPAFVLEARLPLSGRFGFDPGAAWNARDTGFSPNEQKMDVASSPAVELLAAVGLQRYRPLITHDGAITYATWGRPLPLVPAAAAAGTCIHVLPTTTYVARVLSRGSYAALDFATPTERRER